MLDAFSQFYSRIALFLLTRGIRVPGVAKVQEKLSTEMRAAIDRRLMVREIRTQRYRIRRGPFWWRKMLERALVFGGKNRVWASIALKVVVATILVVLPSAIFVLLRGTLPVPERVSVHEPKLKLTNRSNYRTDWLYTEGPFDAETVTPTTVYNSLKEGLLRGINITHVRERGVPRGLLHMGVGSYPTRTELLRGFVVSENAPVAVQRQRPMRIDIAGRNKLRIKFFLFPRDNARPGWCRLQVHDAQDKLLLSAERRNPVENKSARHAFSEVFAQRFTPGAGFWDDDVSEFTLETDDPPSNLKISVKSLSESDKSGVAPQENFKGPILTPLMLGTRQVIERDLSTEKCIFAVGDFSFESERVRPLPRRGTIVALVDTLRADTASDATLMPNYNEYFDKNGIQFMQHRAQANMTVPSVTSLMFSRYPRELSSIAFLYAFDSDTRQRFYDRGITSLSAYLRSAGYRTAAIGNVSLFSESLEGGIDFGFHEAFVEESPQYETRHITEQATKWLEENGETPFFLYLHYHTMHGPYRPPLHNLEIGKFLSSPFGSLGQHTLYDGMARYWDDEFGILLSKLSAMDLLDNVDLYVTADHGAQLEDQPYGNYSGIEAGFKGATSDKGHGLSDEEIHVPFAVHLAGQPQLAGKKISTPSAHIDLFPTIAALMTNKPKELPADIKGLALFPGSQPTAAQTTQVLSARNWLYADAHRYTGLFLYGGDFEGNPMKYVRQLAVDSAMLQEHSWSWRQEEKWMSPEMFFQIDAKTGHETWLSTVHPETLQRLRSQYFTLSPSPQQIKLTGFYDGDFRFDFTVKPAEAKLNFEILPEGIHLEKTIKDGVARVVLSGKIHRGENVLLDLNGALVNSVEPSDITWIGCPGAQRFDSDALAHALGTNMCLFYAPPDDLIGMNFSKAEKSVLVQRSLVWDSPEEIEFKGAGEALRQALRDWGYAK